MSSTELPGGQDMAEDAARMAEQARARAHGVTSDVSREAHRAIDNASRQVDRMARDAGLPGAPPPPMSERINQAMNVAGQQMSSIAGQVRQRAPQGESGEAAYKAADALELGGRYLQQTDPETMLGDVERMIRQNPLQAVGLGVGLGFLIGRALKR